MLKVNDIKSDRQADTSAESPTMAEMMPSYLASAFLVHANAPQQHDVLCTMRTPQMISQVSRVSRLTLHRPTTDAAHGARMPINEVLPDGAASLVLSMQYGRLSRSVWRISVLEVIGFDLLDTTVVPGRRLGRRAYPGGRSR